MIGTRKMWGGVSTEQVVAFAAWRSGEGFPTPAIFKTVFVFLLLLHATGNRNHRRGLSHTMLTRSQIRQVTTTTIKPQIQNKNSEHLLHRVVLSVCARGRTSDQYRLDSNVEASRYGLAIERFGSFGDSRFGLSGRLECENEIGGSACLGTGPEDERRVALHRFEPTLQVGHVVVHVLSVWNAEFRREITTADFRNSSPNA